MILVLYFDCYSDIWKLKDLFSHVYAVIDTLDHLWLQTSR